MQCEKCKFAVWNTTATGRRSPTGAGKCVWEKTFRISASIRAVEPTHTRFVGSWISRKRGDEHPIAKCPVFQQAKP